MEAKTVAAAIIGTLTAIAFAATTNATTKAGSSNSRSRTRPGKAVPHEHSHRHPCRHSRGPQPLPGRGVATARFRRTDAYPYMRLSRTYARLIPTRIANFRHRQFAQGFACDDPNNQVPLFLLGAPV